MLHELDYVNFREKLHELDYVNFREKLHEFDYVNFREMLHELNVNFRENLHEKTICQFSRNITYKDRPVSVIGNHLKSLLLFEFKIKHNVSNIKVA